MKILDRLRRVSPGLAARLLQMTNNTISADDAFMETWWNLVREDRMILTIREAYNIRRHLAESLPLGGDVAEFGVYRGGGAKLIRAFKGGRTLHLFDTFTGMPAVDDSVDLHREGDFADNSLAAVKSYLNDDPSCRFYAGFFPDSAAEMPEDIDFSFVHLDVDIYASTLAGLRFFYPRMKPGGVIISHDFTAISCPGVKKAFDEFFREKCEDVVHLWDTQCMVRKQGQGG
jgi:O-methyltransferase